MAAKEERCDKRLTSVQIIVIRVLPEQPSLGRVAVVASYANRDGTELSLNNLAFHLPA